MRVQYCWITFLFLAGLILAYYLHPSDVEIATLQLKGGRYEKAMVFFKQEYEKGTRKPEIVFPLIQLEIEKGNIDNAILLMKELEQNYPNDPNVLQKLADLYQTNQQYEAYYSVLFRLNNIKSTPDILQELASWYQNNNRPDCLLPILQKLVLSKKSDAGNFQDLALLYAAKKDYESTYATLENLRQVFPKETTLSNIFLEIWAMMHINKDLGKKGTDILAAYLLENKKSADAYYSLGVFREKYPSFVTYLIEKMEPLIQTDPSLEIAMLDILWEKKTHRKVVSNKIQRLYAKDRSNAQLQNLMFYLYLEKKDVQGLKDLTKSIKDTRVIIDLVVFALEQDKPSLVKEIHSSDPMIQVALAIGKQVPEAREKLYNFMHHCQISQTDQYYLLKVAAAANYTQETLELGCSLAPFIGLQDLQLMEMAHVYIQMKKEKELYCLLENSLPEIGQERAGGALALLDISLDNSKNVPNWLTTESALDDLYAFAVEKKEYPLALYLAKRRLDNDPSLVNQADWGLSLVQAGMTHKGLSLLKNLNADPLVENNYLTALAFTAKHHSFYKEELTLFMKKKENLGVSKDLLRNFGYAYLDVLHNFSKGEKIFRTLAKDAKPDDPDVATLVQLWGPKPKKAQVQWLEKNARSAPPEDLGLWLQYLIYVGEYEKVIAMATNTEPNTWFALLDVLLLQKKECELNDVVQRALPHMVTIAQLEKLSVYAEASKCLETRREIWELIVSKTPHNPLAWHQLAKVAYEAHEDFFAACAFEWFFELASPLAVSDEIYAMSLYEYGMILEKHRKSKESKAFFACALETVTDIADMNYPLKELEALLLTKLNYPKKEAIAIMESVYRMSCNNPDVAADFANMLMDLGSLSKSKHLLRNLNCKD